ncbi:hypothetical protein Hanom_Chr04g00292771 [Helianthus anomalus]
MPALINWLYLEMLSEFCIEEKKELREEELVLKAEKAKMEQQVKFMTPHPAACQAEGTKMPVFPGYAYIPMWQYSPQTTCDTSHDHELRPLAA